jgi:hypothetical protein
MLPAAVVIITAMAVATDAAAATTAATVRRQHVALQLRVTTMLHIPDRTQTAHLHGQLTWSMRSGRVSPW